MKTHFQLKNMFPFSKKKTKVTVENERTIVIRRKIRHRKSNCSYCKKHSVFLTVSETAEIFQSEEEIVELFIEQNDIHLIEKNKRENLICLRSLVDALSNKNKIKI